MLKKVLLGMAVLSSLSMAEGTNVYIKAGTDIWQKFDVLKDDGKKMTNEKSKDFSYEIALEATREIYPNFELGLGIAYQDNGNPGDKTILSRPKQDIYMPGYTSIPVYITGKYNIPAEFYNIKPYVKMDLGYSFNDNDDKMINNKKSLSVKVDDGAYFGIGTGLEYNNFTTDVMYKITKSKVKVGSMDKENFDYSRITLSVGYKFNF